MEGSWTFDSPSSDGLSSLEEFQLSCSKVFLDFFACGDESEGVSARFSPRVATLLSVSVVDVPELDMRRES